MRFVWGSGPSMAKGGDLSYKMKSLGWRIKWLIFRYCDQGHKFMSETLASNMNGRGKTPALGLHGSSFMSLFCDGDKSGGCVVFPGIHQY